MVMVMLRRILNNWRSMMCFMLVDRYENRIGAMVRPTKGMGASQRQAPCRCKAPKPRNRAQQFSPRTNILRLRLEVSVTSHSGAVARWQIRGSARFPSASESPAMLVRWQQAIPLRGTRISKVSSTTLDS